MLHILSFLFFIVLIIFIIGVVILAKIVRTISQAGRRMKDAASSAGNYSNQDKSTSSSQKTSGQTSRPTPSRKKIFDSDEGEYVEFEEIK